MKENYDFSTAIKNPYAERLKGQLSHPMNLTKRNPRISMGISFANCGREIETDEMLRFIAERQRGYKVLVSPPGSGISGAGIDAYLVLGAVGSVASVASILWQAYDRFIAPKKRSARDNTGIHISVGGLNGAINLLLGKDVHTKAEFTSRLQVLLAETRIVSNRQTQEQVLEKTEARKSSVRTKTGQTQITPAQSAKQKAVPRRRIRH